MESTEAYWCFTAALLRYSILSQENSHRFHLKCFPKCQLKDTFFTLKLWSTPTQPIPYGFRSARYGDQVICSAAFIEPKCVFLLILLSSLLLWAWAGCDDMILMSVHQVCNQTHLPKINLQYLSLCISSVKASVAVICHLKLIFKMETLMCILVWCNINWRETELLLWLHLHKLSKFWGIDSTRPQKVCRGISTNMQQILQVL